MLLDRTPFRQLARIYGSILSIPPSLASIAQAAAAQPRGGETAAAIDRLSKTLVEARALLQAPPVAPAESARVALHQRMDLQLLLDRSSLVDLTVIDSGVWEEPQTSFLMKLVRYARARHDPVFLDLGSYWGLYALLAMRAGVRRIHAIEADRHNFAQLQAQIFLNNAAGLIHPHNKAVSAAAGVLRCWDSRSHPDGNRGGVGILGSSTALQPSYEVESVAIDAYLPFENELIFIKMDVEGHEDKALEGLRQTIARNRVVLQLEVWPHAAPGVLPLIEELGLRRFHAIEPDFYFTNMTNEDLAPL